ncbi:hypothetical protein EDC01DRAFT_514052 [Geopyxis carbonaria]|nr:hypothetical protein EDC01DRAFT_514052 [Geopyxis carbonaria]
MAYHYNTPGGLSVGEQRSAPRLRPKPSSNTLRSTFSPRPSITPISPPTTFSKSSIPRSASAGAVEMDSSIYTRRERRPSALPKPSAPMERSITPITRPRTGPPTKDHRAFSAKVSDKTLSTGASPEKVALPSEKKFRRVIRKQSSNMSNEKVYTLGGLRSGSTTSFNASTNSLSTTGSSQPGGARSASQGSILGITMPATSNSSQSSFSSSLHVRKRSGSDSSRVPRLMTQDLPYAGTPYDSSPSTRYTDSPFSPVSTPTSVCSQSPGPAAMIRGLSSSPNRPPVTRQRKGSVASIEITLDPVRESTTSASSDSTVRASDRFQSELAQYTRPPSPPAPRNTTVSAPNTPFYGPSKSPKLAPSPRLLSKSATPSPVNGIVQPRRKASVSGIIPRLVKEPTGLGVSLPTSSHSQVLPRTRSRSTGSSFSQPKQRKEAATPPLPSPGFGSSRSMYRAPVPPPKDSPQGITHNTIPPPSRMQNKLNKPPTPLSRERSSSPSKTSPPKPTPTTASRLAFLSRGRTKSEDKPDKLVRRGPTAGTGYEGYGSFGKASRGRSGSSGNGGRSRSDSQNSTTGSVNRSRSGSRPNSRNSGMELELQDEYLRDRLKPVVILGGAVVENQNRPVEMMRSGSSPGAVEMARTGSDQSNSSLSAGRSGSSLSIFRREPSPAGSEKETVAHRRAHIARRAVTPIPHPIDTAVGRRPPPSPSATSSRKQSFDTQDTIVPATPVTATKSKRWNFFQRSQKTAVVVPEPPSTAPAVFARSAAPAPPRRPHAAAHYAILDQDEQLEAEELVERMHKLRQQHVTPPTAEYTQSLRKQQSVHFTDSEPNEAERLRETVRREKADERQMMQQRPKLPQLRTEKLQPRTSEFQVKWDSYGLTPTDAPSGHEKSKDFLEYDPLDIKGKRPANHSAPMAVDDTPLTALVSEADWPAFNDAVATPVVPAEEEVWPEYNELEGLYGILDLPQITIAPALKRTNTMMSTTSSLGAPFQYSDLCSDTISETYDDSDSDHNTDSAETSTVKASDSPTLRPITHSTTSILPLNIPRLNLPRLNLPATGANTAFGPRELLPHTPPAQRVLTPATPFSISDFIRGYGDSESRAVSMLEPLDDTPKAHRSTDSTGSTISAVSSASSGSTATASTAHQISEMKVRPWALLASRWLSFDRVLVSPAHTLLTTRPTGGRVLVLDGLATDDWSFYLALTYPHAKIYNLTPTPPASPSPSSGSPRPANHKQVHHPSYTCAFPFPKGFFDAVSFRFLPPSSLLLSECKRVLAPGGHLELTLLDAELLNAGRRGADAVRLVRAIAARDGAGASGRRPASETALRLLRKKGFAGVSKCFVGLPAVGKAEAEAGAGSGAEGVGKEGAKEGAREGAKDDPEAISEVVSQVGRWWYTRVYERVITAAGAAPARSMWADRSLLKECARKRTNFRMLVCHAQKPLTSSVAKPTTA